MIGKVLDVFFGNDSSELLGTAPNRHVSALADEIFGVRLNMPIDEGMLL